MNNRDLSYLKRHLEELIQQTTKRSKARDQYICPFCGSGTHSHGTGAFTYYPATDTFNCFACGKNGDIFTYYQELYKVDFKTAKERLETLFNERPINTYTKQNNTTSPTYQGDNRQNKNNTYTTNQPRLNTTDNINFNSHRVQPTMATMKTQTSEKTEYKSIETRKKERIEERKKYFILQKARERREEAIEAKTATIGGNMGNINKTKKYNFDLTEEMPTEEIEFYKEAIKTYINLYFEDGNPSDEKGAGEVLRRLQNFKSDLLKINKNYATHFNTFFLGNEGLNGSLIYLRQLNKKVFLRGQNDYLTAEDSYYIWHAINVLNGYLETIETFKKLDYDGYDEAEVFTTQYNFRGFILLMDLEEIETFERFIKTVKEDFKNTLNRLFLKNEDSLKREIGDPSSYGTKHPLLIDLLLRFVTTTKGAKLDATTNGTILTDNVKYKSTLKTTLDTKDDGSINVNIVLTIENKTDGTKTDHKFIYNSYDYHRNEIYENLRSLVNNTVFLSDTEKKELKGEDIERAISLMDREEGDEDKIETIVDIQLYCFMEYPVNLKEAHETDFNEYRHKIRSVKNRLERILNDEEMRFLSPKEVLKTQYKIKLLGEEFDRIEKIRAKRDEAEAVQPTVTAVTPKSEDILKAVFGDDIQ